MDVSIYKKRINHLYILFYNNNSSILIYNNIKSIKKLIFNRFKHLLYILYNKYVWNLGLFSKKPKQ